MTNEEWGEVGFVRRTEEGGPFIRTIEEGGALSEQKREGPLSEQ